jgi:hypothetical protein
MDNLLRLRKETIVFSEPYQMVTRGTKLQILEDLRSAAANVTKTFFPAVTKVPDPMSSTLPRERLVLKRNFSDSTKHVLLGRDPLYNMKMVQFLQQQEIYKDSRMQRLGVNVGWFGVPFIKDMRDQGELRVYFVGCTLAYMILTKPRVNKPGYQDGMDVANVYMTTPLNRLS